MPEPKFERNEEAIRALINALNDDLAREYQASSPIPSTATCYPARNG